MIPTPLLAASQLASLMFAAGCALLTAILLRRSYKYFGQRKRGMTGPALVEQQRPTTEWDGARQDAGARYTRQQVEFQELARELNGQLDSKMILLQQLMKQSDERIARLEELLESAERDDRGEASE